MVRYTTNGRYVQIFFDKKPEDNVIATLKCCGWRWYNIGHCWSNYVNYENIEFAKLMCKAHNPEISRDKEQLKKKIKLSLGMGHVLIRSNSFFCNKNHRVFDLAGELEVCNRFGTVKKVLVPIVFCPICKEFYILEDTYQDLKEKGVALCQVMKYKEYREYGAVNLHTEQWKKKSPLRVLGYYVGQDDELSEAQRRVVLSRIIDSKVLTKDHILSYLHFFIKMHPYDYDAIRKWKADREFVRNYKLGDAVMIKIGSLSYV